MAIARGAGTEIIRSAHFEYVAGNTTAQSLIIGVQHHIYTVLSIICFAKGGCDGLVMKLEGYDAVEGTSAQGINFCSIGATSINETFVWNDKFSFNGFEPTDFAGPLDDAVKQDAIADQGSSVATKLIVTKAHNNDQWEILVTFIDQNNA